MPPPEEVIDNAVDLLAQVQVERFEADPPSLLPFQATTVRWQINAPNGITLRLNGQKVARNGQIRATPVENTTFNMVASAVGGVKASVGQLTVNIDVSSCLVVPFSEEDLDPLLTAAVNTVLSQDDRISLRRDPTLTVDQLGVHIQLAFEVSINNFPNPKFDVVAVVAFRVEADSIEPFYRSFEADVDFPALGDVLILLGGPLAAFIKSFVSSNAESDAKTQLLNSMRQQLDILIQGLPDGWGPHQVTTEPGIINVRICPRPGIPILTFSHPDFHIRLARS